MFGYGYKKVDGSPGDYVMFQLGEAPLGGLGGVMGSPPGTPAHFSVAGVDAAVAAATGAGGTLMADPMDTEFGRMAFLTDPDNAVFGLASPAALA